MQEGDGMKVDWVEFSSCISLTDQNRSKSMRKHKVSESQMSPGTRVAFMSYAIVIRLPERFEYASPLLCVGNGLVALAQYVCILL